MSEGNGKRRVPVLVRANKVAVGMMVLLAAVWVVPAVSSALNGDIAYGALYTGPMLISLAIAFAIWRLPTHV